MPTLQLLICDDDPIFHLNIKQSLKGKFEFRSAYNGDEAIAILKKHPVDVVLLDLHMRSPDEGFQYIPRFLEVDSDLAVVISSSNKNFQAVREAMRLGAADYIVKDFGSEDLLHTLNQVLLRRSLLKRQHQQDFEAQSLHRKNILVGESPQMRTLRRNIEKVRAGSANVVITGETGTGKELVARQLRRRFPDGSLEPFLAVDSATIQSSMAESTLFGHEKGAFTGADKATKGIFEEANGGIVYFDEIGNMPLEIQAKLLRVLQEKEILRIGSSKVMKLEFRVVCATNRNLEEMVSKGQFKDDLLQRLNVIPIELSPLRERREDIKELVEHFVARQHTVFGALEFTENSIRILKAYSWPGNVRELGNLISYLATMIDGKEVDIADLPPKFRDIERLIETQSISKPSTNSSTGGKTAFYDRVSAFEESVLKAEYLKHEGNISQLALALGMDRSHLYSKLKEYGIHLIRRSLAQ